MPMITEMSVQTLMNFTASFTSRIFLLNIMPSLSSLTGYKFLWANTHSLMNIGIIQIEFCISFAILGALIHRDCYSQMISVPLGMLIITISPIGYHLRSIPLNGLFLIHINYIYIKIMNRGALCPACHKTFL